MNKILKKTFYFFSVIMIITAFLFSWRWVTKGFRISKIAGDLPFKNLNLGDEKIDPKILNQKYKYFGRGCQAFVFVSLDDQYVIKFIALQKYNEPFRRRLLKSFNLCKKYRSERTFNRSRNFYNAFESYKIAYKELKDETAVVHMHFNKNNLNQKITLIDNLGFSHSIDLNSSLFIIQKKARPLKSTLLGLLEKKDYLAIDKVIEDYLLESYGVLSKGILNKDSSVKNSGYINGKFIEFDLGRFQKVDLSNFAKHYSLYTRNFRKFLILNAPHLLELFDDRFKKHVEDFNLGLKKQSQ